LEAACLSAKKLLNLYRYLPHGTGFAGTVAAVGRGMAVSLPIFIETAMGEV